MKTPSPRRRFLQQLSAAAAASALPSLADAKDEPAADPANLTPTQALTAAARARFGSRLDAAGLRRLRSEIEAHARRAQVLHAFRLDSVDEPATVFLPEIPD